MGAVFGSIKEEMPKYEVVKSTDKFEIRQYGPVLVAETTYHGAMANGKGSGDAFYALAGYIGVLSAPKNVKPGGEGAEAIAMTAPVLMREAKGEKIAMTAPVLMTSSEAQNKKDDSEPQNPRSPEPQYRMQFVLPSKYTIDTVPQPTDPMVTVKEAPGKKVGAFSFSGAWNHDQVKEKAAKLKEDLQEEAHKTKGEYIAAFYNSPFTIPMFRRNEVWYELE